MHILFATPEISPFTQTTGLGQYCTALASALRTYEPAAFSQDKTPAPNPVAALSVVTPLSASLDKDALRLARRLTPVKVPVGRKIEDVIVYEGLTPQRVRVFFLEHPRLSQEVVNGDAAAHYAFFSRAVVEFCRTSTLPVDVIHCHDWATGLVPVYLDAYGQDGVLGQIMTVFSLHDLDAQGQFDASAMKALGLPTEYFADDALEDGGKINFTKGGILFADIVTTHSDSFARELARGAGGYSLDGALQEREEDLFGVTDGVDYDAWNPASDTQLAVNFSVERLNGKRRNKSDVQHIFGLPARPMTPLLGFLSPLEEAKGVGILVEALDELLSDGLEAQFIVMAEGNDSYKQALVALRDRFPRAVSLHFGQDEALKHRLMAGLDAILLPSRLESGSPIHLQAMRYGTVPVARATGALKDTLADWDGAGAAPKGKGAGVLFDEFSADALAGAIEDTIEMLRTPRSWRTIVQHCMSTNFSWAQVAHQYIEIYKDLVEGDED